MIRAAFRHRHGSDIHEQAIVKEALSKTTLVEWLKAGEVDAAVLPWQLVPRMITGGRFRKLCDVLDLIPELGGASVPTTFFVVQPAFASSRPELISAFRAAYTDAVDLMRADETVWREAAAGPDDSPEMLASPAPVLASAYLLRMGTGRRRSSRMSFRAAQKHRWREKSSVSIICREASSARRSCNKGE